ncbi:hypothetical protein JCM9279_004744 [Rhodotorula babjevae]
MPGAAPPLPSRPGQVPPEDPLPDEPPPPYEPTPAANQQTLEYGPVRPFQPPPHAPPRPAASSSSSSPFAPPPRPPLGSPGPSLPPPSFPFWNGASLTPAQTGFSEGNLYNQAPPSQPLPSPFGFPPSPQPPATFSPPPHAPPQQHSPFPPTSPRHGGRGPQRYEPTETPTPGQPLLNQGRLLVYQPGKELCWKCGNTGYKPFDPFTGYRGDDPSHPCRKCWQKHGRPYTSALRVSLQDPSSPVPAHYQRPLRLLQTPQTRPMPPQVVASSGRFMPMQPGALVVGPGDPRMGGILCRRCGGDGLVAGFLLIDEVTCDACNGVGRVFP